MNQSDPEHYRISDVAQEAQSAMYHYLKTTNALHTTYAVVIVASRTTPGATIIQGHGIGEDDAIEFLRAIIETTDQGAYRTVYIAPTRPDQHPTT